MRLSLATKIFLGFGLVLVVFGAVSIYGITQLNSSRDQLNTVNRGLLPLNRVVAQMETLQESVRKSIDSILHFDNLNRQRSLLGSSRRSFRRNIQARLQQARLSLRRVKEVHLTEDDRNFVSDVGRRLDEISELSDSFDNTLADVILSIDLDVELPADQELVNTHSRTGRQLDRDIQLLRRALKNKITTKMLKMESDGSQATGVIMWLTVIAALVGAIVTVFSLIAMRPVRRLEEGARRISRGEFSYTVEVSSGDEFGALASEFNHMARSLAHREEELVRNQEEIERFNRQLRQSSIDLELMKSYSDNIIRSIPAGILVADPQGSVTTLNPTAEKLWGLKPEETIGRKLSQLPISGALSSLTHEWEKVLREKERLLYEAVEFTVPSRERPDLEKNVLVDLYVSPLTGLDENAQGVLLVGEDVTEKVRTKQALIQSERLATIGRMSAMVAHEIRNPLSSIGLNTELLEEVVADFGAEAEEPQEILRGISKEVERLTEVTEEYLKFARLPKPDLVPEKLDDILIDLLRFVEGDLMGAGIEINNELEKGSFLVRADENQLRQAFLNLFRNSAESMPAGGKLTISSARVDGMVRIEIRDTGKGIDAECLDRIFDPFFSTRENGTGLGLSLTQQIVTEHGGNISCQSKPGQGTSFMVELPEYKKEHAQEDSKSTT